MANMKVGALLCGGMLFLGCMNAPDANQTTTPWSGEGGLVTINTALSIGMASHDVTQIRFTVVEGFDCNADPKGQETIDLAPEPLPQWMEPDKTIGDNHPFATSVFVLEPGMYTVCAEPLKTDGMPSDECVPSLAEMEIIEGQATELIMVSQCMGTTSGLGQATLTLNDAPQIADVDVVPGLTTPCEPVTISITAEDANNDPIVYLYQVAEQPPGAKATVVGGGSSVIFDTDVAGSYLVRVTVADPYGAFSALDLPVDVLPVCN
ncbi:MAG: hypothetical protein ACI9WU_000316 [Myxococcota bacterium]|jgi:hypothetical protein